ncbi:MAG: TlpA disulfide reductase family protein [Crocinitomicaceae bacterium]
MGLFFSTLIISQNITVIDEFDDFKSQYLENKTNDTIHVFNFWATWCKPCVQELPFFDSLKFYNGKSPIKLVLVSLDFENQIKTVLEPFVEKNNITAEVVVLTDGKVNDWIDKVNPLWSGAIPATLVLKGNSSNFYEKSFHSFNELLTTILKIDL